MNLRVATPELISLRVRKVLKERPDADIVAVRAEPHWNGGPFTVDGHDVHVEACTSALAVRDRLAGWTETDGHADRLLVVLCDLDERALGADVIARFTPPRVLRLDPWDAVRTLVGAQRLDAAFAKDDAWLAGALLATAATGAAPPAATTATFTRDAAYQTLAQHLFGAADLGVDALVLAAGAPNPFAALDDLDDEVRTGLLEAIAEQSGPLGRLLSSILRVGIGADLLAIGLAARAVYGNGNVDGGKAAGRIEAHVDIDALEPAVATALAGRCEEVTRNLLVTHLDRANEIIAAAAALAASWGATHPEASVLLPAGFRRRLATAADQLLALDALLPPDGSTDGPMDGAAISAALAAVRDATAAVRAHVEATGSTGGRRLLLLEMAGRLAAWLSTPDTTTTDRRPASFADAAWRYAEDGAWVDQARRRLWRGDDDPDVAAAYRAIIDRVVARRRRENHRFADLLTSWTSAPPTDEALARASLVTVERVTHDIVGALSSIGVLFVVLDGCGLASFDELAPQFSSAGFREIARTGPETSRRATGIAALPTVTEVSRASLIAGHLDTGNQDHERRAFAKLTALGRNGRDPLFFHQNKLLGAAGESLATEVQAAISAEGPAVVGVVVNTIDDHLRKGTFADELRLRDLHALDSLLDAARNAGRAVVISADHGHVLAQPDDGGTGTYAGGGSGGERWRTADRPPTDVEVLLRGTRVLRGGDSGILAPWDDDFRYGAKAGGYHGGATPEEVLVPAAAFVPAGIDPPDGWQLLTTEPPLWWAVRATPEASQRIPPSKTTKKPTKAVPENQPSMFEVEAPPATPPGPVGITSPPWLDALLASEIWTAQKRLIGRTPLPEDRVRSVLTATSRRGGVASYAALANDTQIPAARLAGFLATVARVLNVDSYVVLDVDGNAQEARLSTALLAQQFQIDVADS